MCSLKNGLWWGLIKTMQICWIFVFLYLLFAQARWTLHDPAWNPSESTPSNQSINLVNVENLGSAKHSASFRSTITTKQTQPLLPWSLWAREPDHNRWVRYFLVTEVRKPQRNGKWLGKVTVPDVVCDLPRRKQWRHVPSDKNKNIPTKQTV